MTGRSRLRALDAGFLLLETARTPMHVAAAVTLEREPFAADDGRIRLDAIVRHVEGRLHLVPDLRQMLREVPGGLGRPIWVDDPDFDVRRHVRLMSLPAPGDQHALDGLVDDFVMSRLDRSRPLWEWWVVDGSADGRLVILIKVHHALVDGMSGVNLLGVFADLDVPAAERPWVPSDAPGDVGLVAGALCDQVRSAAEGCRALLPGSGSTARALRSVAGATARRLRSLTPTGGSLTQSVGAHRTVRSVSLSLPRIARVAHRADATINDVVLTAVTGGLRSLLRSRGESLDARDLRALVPESLRRADEDLTLGNRISAVFPCLPVHEDDPLRVLHLVRESMRSQRLAGEDVAVDTVLRAADDVPYRVLGAVVPLIHHQPWVSTIVTNVPGPHRPLTMMGSQVLAVSPIVPLSGNMTLGVAVLSYTDDLRVTVTACRDAVPDLDVMLAGLASSVADLERRVNRRRGGRPPRD